MTTVPRTVLGVVTASALTLATVVAVGPGPAVGDGAAATAAGSRIAITEVSLMGAKKIRLVRGVPTTLDVVVTNTGARDLDSFTVVAQGRGIKGTSASSNWILDPGDSVPVETTVRLTAKRRAVLKLTVRSGGVRNVRKVQVVATKPPARPRPGRYASKNKNFTFTIKPDRTVAKFSGTLQLQCGVWPNYTYPIQTHGFPRVKVPRSGRVHQTRRVRQHRMDLEMFARGGRVTHGDFYVSGGNCYGSHNFTARRIGGGSRR